MEQMTIEDTMNGPTSLTGSEMVDRLNHWVLANWYAWERIKEIAIERAYDSDVH